VTKDGKNNATKKVKVEKGRQKKRQKNCLSIGGALTEAPRRAQLNNEGGRLGQGRLGEKKREAKSETLAWIGSNSSPRNQNAKEPET